MAKTLVLQQDDCAPDAMEYFEKDFAKMFGMTFFGFKQRATKFINNEDGFMSYTFESIIVEIDAGDPYYKVYIMSKKQQGHEQI